MRVRAALKRLAAVTAWMLFGLLCAIAPRFAGAQTFAPAPKPPAPAASASASAAPPTAGSAPPKGSGAPAIGPTPAPAPGERHIILVGAFTMGVDGEQGNKALASLRVLLHRQIVTGLQAVDAFEKVVSYYAVLETQESFEKSMSEVSKWGKADMEKQFDALRKAAAANTADRFLHVTVLPMPNDGLRVDLDLYAVKEVAKPNGKKELLWSHIAAKSLGTCGQPRDEVVDLARDAMRSLAAPKNGIPRATVKSSITPKATGEVYVPLNTELTLDACQSSDPDYDSLTWRWEQVAPPAPGAKTVLPPAVFDVIAEGGVGGQRFRFTPQKAATYAFRVAVTEARAHPGQTAATDDEVIVIHAYEPARPDAGTGRVIDFPDTGSAEFVTLDASKSTPAVNTDGVKYVWRQTGGPRVDVLSPTAAKCTTSSCNECAGAQCKFQPSAPGTYTFEVELTGPEGAKRAGVSFLVARAPRVVLVAESTTTYPHTHLSLKLINTADELDPAPRFLWRVHRVTNAIEEQQAEDGCRDVRESGPAGVKPEAPSTAERDGRKDTAMLLDATSASPVFVATGVGRWVVTARIFARRQFNGRDIFHSSCKPQVIEVVKRPTFQVRLTTSFLRGIPATPNHSFLQPTLAGRISLGDAWSVLRVSLIGEVSFFRIDLAPAEPHHINDPAFAGGVEFTVPDRIVPRVELGYRIMGHVRIGSGPDGGARSGFEHGAIAMWSLTRRFMLVFAAGIIHITNADPEPKDAKAYLKSSLGCGFQF